MNSLAGKLLSGAVRPLINLLDRSDVDKRERPLPAEEATAFPRCPWDLRTVIIVFPPSYPFKYMNLNILLGLPGFPLDQPEKSRNFAPGDLFDLQFCMDGPGGTVQYKQCHSIERELQFQPGQVSFELGERLSFKGQWPRYDISYSQPETNFSARIKLNSRPWFHWWARFPKLYCHYTSFCDCDFKWKLGEKEGRLKTSALHDHGWGARPPFGRSAVGVFRYEVMKLPGLRLRADENPHDAFAISLWAEARGRVELKSNGLLRPDGGATRAMDKYKCRVIKWGIFDNYAGKPYRVPEKLAGLLRGDGVEFEYEAARTSEPSPVLGEGFLYSFDFEGVVRTSDGGAQDVKGAGYAEQMGGYFKP